ncbi:mannose-1-phosphate guanylyltransferase/mannose-6-phosphate isomerase, partial [Escherichia coli]|nr:mannose-1-phosphate guanylyltransferase/mannose-6-phosphate isomerase [Escherichia coli]EFK4703099.1 mannose-1-phosphate guanylyltransferase/mannose-6-phosphate isomerase [Escherichia coli]
MIIPIIMAGGSGTRLWPLSRSLYPKQFLSLINENSLLQETLKRLDGLNCLPPVIVSNNEHRFIVAEQLRQFGVDDFQIILEPVGRNTAPAVALAALKSLELHGDHHMLVLAADHAIQDIEAFHAAVLAAEQESVDNKLVTFGIVPTKPETGYGYIKKGEQVKNSVFKVNSFVEKPDLETAKNYLEQKCYLWNSGMFMFKASVYLDELKKFRPDILAACKESLSSASTDLDFIRLNSDVFAECPDESIDYAVMEKTQDCVVIPLDADWSDIGSWTSLWEISEKDEHENVS